MLDYPNNRASSGEIQVIRYLGLILVLLLTPLAARGEPLPELAAAADDYAGRLQRPGGTADPVESRAARAQAETAAGRGEWAEAVVSLEQAVTLGDDGYEVWSRLAAALPRVDRRQDAASAAYLAYLAAVDSGERGQALFTVGRLLEELDRPREARVAYEAGLYLTWDEAASQRYSALSEAPDFRVTDAYANLEGESPEVCIRFRQNLQDTRSVLYQDYVKLDPALNPAFSVAADTLCLAGVEYGATYDVTVLAGLPSLDDERLAVSEKLRVEVGDRDPSIGFRGSSYVLPNIADAGVPLVSVNVERARLQLLRINDRGLVQQLQEGRFLRALDAYELARAAGDYGEEVWRGELAIDSTRNRPTTTSIPIREVLPQRSPGVYVLAAEPADEEFEDWYSRATQWLIVTDLGLTTLSGQDGLHVFVRSLDTGAVLPSVELRLYARNNEELGRVVTGADGSAAFPPGLLRATAGKAPAAVMAFGAAGDFSFLDLTRPAFDLSDRGVGGRLAPSGADLFLYTDRGVYRPGETVQLSGLLRGGTGEAMAGLPLTLRILRPDGVEAERTTIASPDVGFYHLPLPISPTARTGGWTVLGYLDPAGEPIGQASFLVEEVVPARIEVSLAAGAPSLEPGASAQVEVEARYLYGAPAANLPVKGDVTVRRNDDPYPMHPGYRFGLADEPVEAIRIPLDATKTDAKGKANLGLTLSGLPETVQPLEAVLQVEVLEFGGRPVIESLELPVWNRSLALGIKPLFADDQVREGSEAAFEVIAALPDGTRAAAAGLSYQFIRENWDYQWFYRDGSWDYEVVVRDEPLGSGDVSVTAGEPGRVSSTVSWGRYRLEVYDPVSGAAVSTRFSGGWAASPGIGDTPDRLQVIADRSLYRAGEQARVLIRPPFAGPVLLAVATDRVLATRTVDATADGTEIEIPIDPSWGAGAYLLASAFRPDGGEVRGPGRAIGVVWLGIDPSDRSLAVTFDLPQSVEPRRRVDIPVTVTGLTGGGDAYLTLAAVDEGVLQITDFQTPSPQEHFFGKRRLGIEIRDLYGQLIDARLGRRGQIREGGDLAALSRRGAPPPTLSLVAMFSPLVKLDSAGRALVPLDLPDYNGRLRLMAVAFDAERVGSAEAALVVRDPLVTLVSLPRFLASGDASELTLTAQNLSAPAGSYRLTFIAEGAVRLAGAGSVQRELKTGDSLVERIGIRAEGNGIGRILLAVAGPGGFRLERSWQIGVRAPQLSIVDRVATTLQPGQSLRLSADALARFLPGSGELLASFSPVPELDVPGLLRTLDRYPYGCLEQTTSRALPLLYVGSLASLWGGGGDTAALRPRLQEAIGRVLEMQRFDGSFGQWRPEGGAEPWLTAYAMDFLTRARQQGFTVPEAGYAEGLRWLARYGGDQRLDDYESLGSRAYAQFVLASAQAGDLSALRYLQDNYAKRMPTPLAAAQLGAALALQGDQERAGEAFHIALSKLDRQRRPLRDYGTSLRDLAATVALMAQSNFGGRDLAPLLERLAAMLLTARYLSTQEQSWLILAAWSATAANEGKRMQLSIDGAKLEPRSESLNLRPDFGQLLAGLSIRNEGEAPVWSSQTLMGVPEQDLPPMADGFTIERRYYSLAGDEIAPERVPQSEVVVVVISGASQDDLDHQALIVDLLPAGFELENAHLAGSRAVEDLAWLPALSSTLYSEFLDDRFVSALDLGEESREFVVAYFVRAVTPGSYRLPAVEVEDMYQPRLRARTAMGSLTVTPLP